MNKFSLQSAAGAVLLAAASASQAFVVIGISDTVGPNVFCSTASAATVALCSAGFSGSGAGGSILVGDTDIRFTGIVGGFKVSTTSLASNTPGSAVLGLLDQSSTRVERQGVGVGTLFIDSFGFNYSLPVGPVRSYSGSVTFNSSLYADADLVASVLSVDPTNAGGDETSAFTTNFSETLGLPPYTGASKSASKDFAPVEFTGLGSYSLRHKQAYTIANSSIINATATSVVRRVPEPMTLSLVGVALLGAAVAARRAKKV